MMSLVELLERERELAAIAGARGCVLITGPPGSGKTALLDHLATTPVVRVCGGPLERWVPRPPLEPPAGATVLIDDAHLLDARWLTEQVERLDAVVIASETPLPADVTVKPRALSERALARLDPDTRTLLAGDPLPIVARIATPGGLRLARAIAVAGGGGTIAARLAGLDVRGAVEAAEALLAAGVLRGDGFVHPLVRDAVYAGIPARERADLHAYAARLVPDPDRAAAHLQAGGTRVETHGLDPAVLESLARLRLAQGRAGEALSFAREHARRTRTWTGATLAAALAATGRTSEAHDAREDPPARPAREDVWSLDTLGSLRTIGPKAA